MGVVGLIRPEESEFGFSFVELMVVIALISVLSAIAIPSFLHSLPEKRLKSAVRNLYADIQRARLLAVKENKDIRIRFVNNAIIQDYYFDEDNNKIFNDGEFERDLTNYGSIHYGCSCTKKNWNKDLINSSGLPSDPRITFSATGTCDSRSIYLQSENNHAICYAVTTTDFGNVKIRKFNGTSWENN